jgi:hypothetical protein
MVVLWVVLQSMQQTQRAETGRSSPATQADHSKCKAAIICMSKKWLSRVLGVQAKGACKKNEQKGGMGWIIQGVTERRGYMELPEEINCYAALGRNVWSRH